jgi:hypothetical protein
LRSLESLATHTIEFGEIAKSGEASPGADAAGLQCSALSLGDTGDEREVVVTPPSSSARIAPSTDGAVLNRIRVWVEGRVLAGILGQEGLQLAADLTFVRCEALHLERGEFAMA